MIKNMGYILTEEQQLLKDSAKDILKAAPVSLLRDLRDARDELMLSMSLWRDIVASGWPGLAADESVGGLGFGMQGVAIAMQECGRTLSATPLVSTVIGTYILEHFGSTAQKMLIRDITLNGHIIAIAIQEGAFYNPYHVSTILDKSTQTINGNKQMVADAHVADHLLVSVLEDGHLAYYLVDSKSEGIHIVKELLMDSRYYSQIHLQGVSVTEQQRVGDVSQYRDIADVITDIASILIGAELVGLMDETFARTVAYLKERQQFGVAIGTFQGLQHRAADAYCEIEIAKSMAMKACMALEGKHPDRSAICSAAKQKASKVAQLVTNEGIQMFGGIGMTDDEEIGFFMKRARVAAQQYGNTSYHIDRYARLRGY